jgi:hypothetical protein
MTSPLLVIVIISFSILAVGAYFGWHGRKFMERLEHVEQELNKRKLPGRVMDGLEDAMAITNDCGFQNNDADQIITTLVAMLDRSEATRAYMNTRLGHLANKLQALRTEPGKYDADAANQKRTI